MTNFEHWKPQLIPNKMAKLIGVYTDHACTESCPIFGICENYESYSCGDRIREWANQERDERSQLIRFPIKLGAKIHHDDGEPFTVVSLMANDKGQLMMIERGSETRVVDMRTMEDDNSGSDRVQT